MEHDPTRADTSDGRASSSASAGAWLGREVDGRYRIVEQLGEGGMGAVFLAEHLQLQKRVALKVIHGQLAGNDEIAARFAREAMTSAHIEHPNVASALDFGRLPEGGAYLVMQYVRGPSLRNELDARGALPWPEVCEIGAQIADAIAAAHAHGIVHRDLKPENVVLVPNESGPPTVKVLDFGIAHVKAHSQAPEPAARALTQVGMIMGTPGYMPPEQATGAAVDERADLYALGVMLWEMLAGVPPFREDSFSAIVMRQLREPAPELMLTGATIPDALRGLVRTLLEREPKDRPSSAADVRDKLRALAKEPESATALAATIIAGESQVARLQTTLRTRAKAIPPAYRYGAVALAAAVGALLLFGRGTESGASALRADPLVETTKAESNVSEKPVLAPAPARKREAEPLPPSAEGNERVEASSDEGSEAREAKANESGAVRAKKSASANRKAKARAKSEPRPKAERGRPAQRLKRALNELFD